ncbi:NADH pyrophosphatase [Enterovibrio norvegicus]|uniref:NAD(+) diphosphatase n=1 Tax=Enterovibrio norvegicus TaxID=188144 RepID=UPI0002DC72FB|nr:NAD(+) diphosphatase [Enterovibrio norvegicus]OEE46404.1 NADH pyrophosphatase [Enterovibrio norvegicus]
MSNQNDVVYLCCVTGGKLWQPDHSLPLISIRKIEELRLTSYEIGHYRNHAVHVVFGADVFDSKDYETLRALLSMPAELFALAGKAVQLEYMRNSQRFCASCGSENHFDATHPAMVCSSCQTVHYPRVSPCIIVAVTRGNQILLAHHPRHKEGMYTVLAGFVEAGETLEQCVAREVEEETGIKVKNIRYLESQPWAFPSNLMMGFFAEYESGDIHPDYEELSDAQWFEPHALPLVAPKGTIARKLIDTVCSQNKETPEA